MDEQDQEKVISRESLKNRIRNLQTREVLMVRMEEEDVDVGTEGNPTGPYEAGQG